MRGWSWAATHHRERQRIGRGRAENLSDNDGWLRFRRANSTLVNAAAVVMYAMATMTRLARLRSSMAAPWRPLHPVRREASGQTTRLAVPRSMPRAKAEEAAGWEGTPGGDVVPRQTVEAETNERRRHRPLATRVRRSMAVPASAPTTLNQREAIASL
jgi:hypothetical protein